ncbi:MULTISPECIES: type II secretion system F family protein [unclassified Pseudofrankia]|uniref:type II secretion system F family protein n=1 Tax=unclassified Pseudofrankia TaxID=2994372 RepID=UPI0008D9E7D2|nr:MULTISPECIES: type II secretion system F family protein [unclassified Pseudofrankia]MDT3441776.1 type II secretion system F family protein [Pseudofrankia sp. BMG5.37]OHV47070.1 hypothetical protein BCD48_20210 [Pseudofrankia sp. BMG5.36]
MSTTASVPRLAARLVGVTAVAGTVLGAAMVAGRAGAIVAALVTVVTATAARAGRRAAAQRRTTAARAAAEDLLAAFAAELDAGADPDAALRAAAAAAGRQPSGDANGDIREVLDGTSGTAGDADGHAAGAGELVWLSAGLAAGEDPARLLAGCRTPALRQLGAALWVCRTGGARLVPVAMTLAAQARADTRRAGELAAALAGPRSSGRLVAGLPVVGIVFAGLLGARPAHVLLATPTGSACLAAGVALDLLGLRWLRWIGDRVVRDVESVAPRDAHVDEHARRPRAGPARRPGFLPDRRSGRSAIREIGDPVGRRSGRSAGRSVGRPALGAVLTSAMGACAGVLLAHGQRGPGAIATVGAAALLVGAALPADPGRARRARLLADLPLALDLIAACLAAGATVPAALEATAAGVAGPLGVELRATARGLRLGATAAGATARLVAAGTGPTSLLDALRRRVGAGQRASSARPLMAAAQALGRVETSGARLADGLTRIAARARAQAHDEAIGAARRAGVAAAAPLGLCFLPAFLLLGVVPTILGSLPGALPA